MDLLDIVRRTSRPKPWAEGDNIPWNEPAFSERMLKEHLSQSHDAASRRSETIDRHVQWIHGDLLSGQQSRILDLGCGPGLYLQRLARLGHECVGIDFSPASIAYAAEEAKRQDLGIVYSKEDLRSAEFGTGFDLVMLIFGELNVFAPQDAEAILRKACDALTHRGSLLLEVHSFDAIRRRGQESPSWYSAESGLFSDGPHVCLQENSWDDGTRTATTRYYIVDVATGDVTRHAQSFQAYSDDEYESLLVGCGFAGVRRYQSLTGTEEGTEDLTVLVGSKQGL